MDYLDEENSQLNPIDFIINLNYYREGFMFDAPNKSIISSELKKLKKKSVEDQREASKNDMLKYFKIPPYERMEFIKMKGEIIDYSKILDKYQPINMKSMPIGTEITSTESDYSHKEYSKVVTLELYKKKGITNNILNDQQKEFIDFMKKKRVKKNKEIMRGLIRDN